MASRSMGGVGTLVCDLLFKKELLSHSQLEQGESFKCPVSPIITISCQALPKDLDILPIFGFWVFRLNTVSTDQVK